jgi:hypothetical protein
MFTAISAMPVIDPNHGSDKVMPIGKKASLPSIEMF